MRPGISPEAQEVRERREQLIEHSLIWILARDRDTDEEVGLGIWTGRRNRNFVVTDMFTGTVVERTFVGAGAILEMPELTMEIGLNVRSLTVTVSDVHDQIRDAVFAYTVQRARTQIHKVTFDPASMAVAGVEPWYKGRVNKAPRRRGTPGGASSIEIQLVSTARDLTIPSTRKKSHEAQLERGGDKFRRHRAAMAGVELVWGGEKVKAPRRAAK